MLFTFCHLHVLFIDPLDGPVYNIILIYFQLLCVYIRNIYLTSIW